MHGPFWRTVSLWVFLTMITVSQFHSDKDRQQNQGLQIFPSANLSELDAETETTPRGVSFRRDDTSNRTEYPSTTPNLPLEPSTNKSESNAGVKPLTEHEDPLDLHSRLACDKGSCRKRCEDTGSPFSENPDLINLKRFETRGSVTNECRCDKNCMVFGDCCFDYFSLCLGTNLTTLLSNVQTAEDVAEMIPAILGDDAAVFQKASMYLYKTCHVVHEKNGESSYWMISNCPQKRNRGDSSSQEVYESKCRNTKLDPLGTVPASMIRDPAIVFRNVYCALCNGIEQEKVKLWESFAECPEVKNTSRISYKEFLFKLKECVINSESLEGAPKCSPERDEGVAACPLYEKQGETFRTYSLHCRSYLYPLITDSDQQTTNWHCSACSKRMSFRDTKYKCNIPSFHFYDALMPVCQELSCGGRCHNRKTASNCQCDLECLLFGDCCYDFIPECLGQEFKLTEVSGNETLIGRLMFQKNLTSDHNLKMLYITHRACVSVSGSKDQMLWVIGSCPDNSNTPQSTSVGTAINQTLIAPASHKDDPSIIFRNIYCGLCHGISLEDLIQWNTSIYCSEPVQSFVSEEELLFDGTCILKALELKGGRYCSQEDTKIVPNSPEPPDPYLSRILCEAYRYPVYSKSEHVLRNPHCEQKMGVVHSCVSKQSNAGPEHVTVPKQQGLSILFNFNENGVSFSSRDGVSLFPEVSCQIDEVYDHYHDICKKLHCHQGKVAINGSCIRNGTWFAEERNMVFVNGTKEFIIACYIFTKKTLTKSYVRAIMHEVIEDTEVAKYQSLLQTDDLTITNVSYVPNFLTNNSSKYKDGEEHIKHLQITVKKTSSVPEHLDAFSIFFEKFLDIGGNAENILDVSVQNFVAENEVTCSFGVVMVLRNTSIDTVNDILYANDSDKLYPLDNVAFVCSMRNIPHLRKVFVCDIPLNCDPVVYNLTDFTSEDGIFKSLHSDLILSNDSYYVSGEQVLSCHNFTRSFFKNQSNLFFMFDHVQDILSHVTSGISLISLISTLSVYVLLPELRNLPGRLTMSLSTSLMLAQGLLLLIHLPTGVLCQTLAVTLHFLWLCSFMWMTAMSINLARTFTRKMKGSSMTSIAGTHARFSLFVIGLPLLIVTVSAVLDFLDISGIDIGYGKHGMCWIANPRASLLVFGVPLALIILVNLIAFILTFYHIEKSMRASKDISSTKGDRFKVIIYGKLFIIMGLSWGFSFAAAFAEFAALWYIFILLNGLQGFYIFISFVCTDRVKRLLKKKILGPDKEDSTSAQKTETMSKI